MKRNRLQYLSYFLILMMFLSVGFFSFSAYKKDRQAFLSGKKIVYHQGDVLGVSTEVISVDIDFKQQIAFSSPLIFGGAHSPKDDQAWNELQTAGVTFLRSDFYLDRFLPTKITLDDYRKNVNGVREPQNWNKAEIQKVHDVFTVAKQHNMKTMGIMAYSIPWLTTSGTNYGPAKDWDVYEDIVEKSYRIFRNDVDYLEVWNEPDMDSFMNINGSGITKEQAYLEVVKKAVKVIRKVDSEIKDGKRMKIGVGVTSRPTNAQFIDKVLSEKSVFPHIDFVSYHNYEHSVEPSYGPVKAVLQKYGVPNIPIFITEWSHTPNIKQADPLVLTDQGIPYVGSKFISYMNMGIGGANYFSLQPVLPNSPRGDEGFLGIYTLNGSNPTMLPTLKTWSLMSQTLSLGKGQGKVFKVSDPNQSVAAWQNVNNEYGVVVANSSLDMKQYNFNLSNLPIKGDVLLSVYVASSTTDGKQKVSSSVIRNADINTNFKAIVPANSVVGVVLTKATWQDKLTF